MAIMTRKPPRMADCHPELPAVARKMCNRCYASWWWVTIGRPKLKKTGKVPAVYLKINTRHPDYAKRFQDLKERNAMVYQLEQDARKDETTEIRRCQACSVILIRWPGEPDELWDHRFFCGVMCETLAYALGPNWKELFPGAAYQFKKEVPDSCGRCRGLLTEVPSGFQCLSCGRVLAVVECLMVEKLLRRRDVNS